MTSWWRRRERVEVPLEVSRGGTEELYGHAREVRRGSARISLAELAGADMIVLDLVPHRRDAAEMQVCGDLAEPEGTAVMGLTISVDGCARFEIGVDDDDLDFARQVIDAVVDRRVRIREAPGRSETTLTLRDGSTVVSRRWSLPDGGLVPRPGWRSRADVRECAPYR